MGFIVHGHSVIHHKEDRQYEIIPEIKKMVTFTCLSLVEMSALSNASTMDIIFCRNVLMYFTNEWVNKISQNLFNSLSEEGWLIVSSCELSSNLFPQFTPVNFPGAVLYRKGKNGSVHSSPSISYETERIQPLSAEASAKVDLTPSTFTRHSLVAYAPKLQQRSGEGGSSTLHQPPTNVKPPEESITDKLFAIRLLADQGFLSESLSLCNKTIASDKLAPGLYFMRASILQEMGKSSEAIASLRQGIYINPDNVMGHFILGNLFIRMGNTKNSKRSFKNVLDLLNGSEDDDILPDSEGLSVKYIREIIHANMQTQQRNEKRNPYQT
jgi:chemotaxis protein methyltransferase CheR